MKNIAIYQTNPTTREQILLNLFEGSAFIGSGTTAEIIVNDLRCAGIHAMIKDLGDNPKSGKGEFLVIDLGNGANTFYNNKRSKEFTLTSGDHFTIGNTQLTVKKIPKIMLDYQELLPKIDSPENVTTEQKISFASDKTLLETSIYWGQQLIDSRTFEKGASITVGGEIGNTFAITLPDRQKQRIALYKNSSLLLHLPHYAKGIFWEGEHTYTLEQLKVRESLTESKSDLTHTLRVGDRADIQLGEMILSFKFVVPSKEIKQFAPIKINRDLLKIYLMVLAFLLLVFGSIWLFSSDEPAVPQVPEKLRKVLYEAGIKNAKTKKLSAIGEILAQGGRARGEEGASKSQKTQKTETSNQLKKESKVESKTETAKTVPNQTTQTIQRPDLTALSSTPQSSSSVGIQISGPETTGNTLSSIAQGSFARGRQGLGSGGGGQSVGIGQLKGISTGGGLGADDTGISASKGITVESRTEEEVILKDALDQELINAIIKRYLPQIDHCYQMRLVVKPKLKGKVKVSFDIVGDGSVKQARVVETTLRDLETEKCITEKISNWKFPAPKGGGKVKVTYPFILMSTGDSE